MSDNKKIKMTMADGTTIEGTAEELAKLQKLLPSEEKPSELAPGDYAKVIGPTCFGDINEGTIVKILGHKDPDGGYRIDHINQEASDYDYAHYSSLEKLELSVEEIAFLSNGRDIGELKEGDIAEVIKYVGGDRVGTLVEVSEVVGIYVRAKGHDFFVGVTDEPYLYSPEDLKLIALAEKRADAVA